MFGQDFPPAQVIPVEIASPVVSQGGGQEDAAFMAASASFASLSSREGGLI